jgi:hypothetical protein
LGYTTDDILRGGCALGRNGEIGLAGLRGFVPIPSSFDRTENILVQSTKSVVTWDEDTMIACVSRELQCTSGGIGCPRQALQGAVQAG